MGRRSGQWFKNENGVWERDRTEKDSEADDIILADNSSDPNERYGAWRRLQKDQREKGRRPKT